MENDVKFKDKSTGDKSKHQQFTGKLINLTQTGSNIRFIVSRIRLIMRFLLKNKCRLYKIVIYLQRIQSEGLYFKNTKNVEI